MGSLAFQKQFRAVGQNSWVDYCKYDGVLRCSGRLNNSELELDCVHPIIMPGEHRLTELIIESCHV